MNIEEYNERRITNVENAITKLTEISADLNKVLAVQEQRLTQNERSMSDLENIFERRREEQERKIQNVYDVMRVEDNKILEELELMRTEQKQQHDSLSSKFQEIQKILWIYMGGFSVIVFLLTNGSKFLSLFGIK